MTYLFNHTADDQWILQNMLPQVFVERDTLLHGFRGSTLVFRHREPVPMVDVVKRVTSRHV